MDLSMDLTDLDLGDPGSWPVAVRASCFALVGIAVLGLGYLLVLADKRDELARSESREQALRNEFDSKRDRAASLDVHRVEYEQAVAALTAVMRRLPRDTEIPGLIDDISDAAIANHLVIEGLDLGDERRADLYLELPIAIAVGGDYANLAAFAGAIADLTRRVTLHDFDLVPRTGPGDLVLSIEARTYRYSGETESDSSGMQR